MPRLPEQIFDEAETVAAALLAMRRVVNPGPAAERIRDLGEADSLSFGNVTVIAFDAEEEEKAKRFKKLSLNERSEPMVEVHEQPLPDNKTDVQEVAVEVPRLKSFKK